MKKKWIVLLSILFVLIIARIVAPVFLTSYANKSLQSINGYNGTVEDVDLRIYKGAYIIKNVSFMHVDTSFDVPFMSAREVEIMIDWDVLFEFGKMVAHIEVRDPELNFVTTWQDDKKNKKITQSGKEADWLKHFIKMSPLDFNALVLTNGKVKYHNKTTTPEIALLMDSIKMDVRNLQNLRQPDSALPANIEMSARMLESGTANLDVTMDFKAEPMNFDANLSIENVDLVKANELMKSYANLDFESGLFDLYTEMKMKEGQVNGYVKPILRSIKIKGKEEEGSFTDKLWETLAGGVIKIFENEKEDQLATKVTISGSMDDPNININEALWNLWKNAVQQAFYRHLENSVQYSSEDAVKE